MLIIVKQYYLQRLKLVFAIEAVITRITGFKIFGLDGVIVGMHSFGESAPAN